VKAGAVMDEGGTPTDMRQIFANLRNVVSTEWNSDAPAVFDELIREHEWELALHVVCDYLLEPATPPAAPELIEKIQSLHKVMGIEDSCVTDLRRKAGQGDGLKRSPSHIDGSNGR